MAQNTVSGASFFSSNLSNNEAPDLDQIFSDGEDHALDIKTADEVGDLGKSRDTSGRSKLTAHEFMQLNPMNSATLKEIADLVPHGYDLSEDLREAIDLQKKIDKIKLTLQDSWSRVYDNAPPMIKYLSRTFGESNPDVVYGSITRIKDQSSALAYEFELGGVTREIMLDEGDFYSICYVVAGSWNVDNECLIKIPNDQAVKTLEKAGRKIARHAAPPRKDQYFVIPLGVSFNEHVAGAGKPESEGAMFKRAVKVQEDLNLARGKDAKIMLPTSKEDARDIICDCWLQQLVDDMNAPNVRAGQLITHMRNWSAANNVSVPNKRRELKDLPRKTEKVSEKIAPPVNEDEFDG